MNWPEVLNVRPVFLCFLFLASARISIAGDIPAPKTPMLRIEEMMNARELLQTGLLTLSPQQRQTLNAWLLKNMYRIFPASEEAGQENSIDLRASLPFSAQVSNCDPAIESHISGDFRGWNGETTFVLDNGEIWKQAERGSVHSYSYSPIVTIYETPAGCRMMVEDEEDTILVRRTSSNSRQ
jgi:hypothetical protein